MTVLVSNALPRSLRRERVAAVRMPARTWANWAWLPAAAAIPRLLPAAKPALTGLLINLSCGNSCKKLSALHSTEALSTKTTSKGTDFVCK